MKTLVLTALLALTAVSGVVVTAHPAAAQTDRGPPPSSRHYVPPPRPLPPTALPAPPPSTIIGRLKSGLGTRGAEDTKSVCDVAPPCPSGCIADPATHKCTEWQAP